VYAMALPNAARGSTRCVISLVPMKTKYTKYVPIVSGDLIVEGRHPPSSQSSIRVGGRPRA
jgi:hypothetical protein